MMKQSKGGKKGKAKYTRQELAKLREYGELDPLNSKGEFGGLDEAITNAFSKKMTNMVGTFTVGEKKRKTSKRAKESGQLIKHEVADDKSIDEIDYREFTKKKKKNSKDKLKKLIELIGNDESEIEVQRENSSAVGENGTINGNSHDSEKKSARKKKNNSVLGFGDVITEDSKEESEIEEEPDKINDPFVKRTSYLEAEISKCLTLTDSKGDNILEPITFQDKELNVVMDYIPQHSKVQETFKEIISTKSKKLSSYQVKTRLVNNFSSMNASAVGKEGRDKLFFFKV
ncbi:hypothetical protein AX774_g2603 [Zancudomyces culisetae]|uniref:Uncharacterized protein n=1 Tax=Zancudomyces culisetae TaxID=1213189 RepID=A0A1R1PSF0_ZANCU|nr:hypothetical protein AX774_g2603 [Zancudomyces culisetae]|eukprot:OMH83888.1 hypothetical protein AX774_g2603 [Zancudomyces culisetae]